MGCARALIWATFHPRPGLTPHPPSPPNVTDPTDSDVDESFLPPFANAENRALDRAIREKERTLDVIEDETEESRDRVGVMAEHLKAVQQELVFTQSRVESKAKEAETERHMKRMSEMAITRVREDIKRMEREELDLNDKTVSLQTSVHRGNEKLEQFKLLMNWNQEELEQWATASKQKEEDNLALEKYQRADEARVRELNQAIEKMTKAVHAKRTELENEVTDTQTAQIELDRAAEDFRALHAERQNLVRQWEDAILSMKQRDHAIQEASRLFAARKKELRIKQQTLDERARFLDQELANNKEIDAAIQTTDRGLGALREEYASETTTQRELQDEVDIVKNTLAKAAADLAQADAGNEAKGMTLAEKRKKLERARKKVDAAVRRLEEEKVELMSLEEKQAELERIMRDNESELDAVMKEGAAHKELLVKSNQELTDLRAKERDLASQIEGGRSQNKSMTQKIKSLDALVLQQQENLYNIEFQIQGLERKVARAGGLRSDEESRVMNAKIAAIQAVLDERTAEFDILTSSVKRAEDDLAHAKRKNNDLKKSAKQVADELHEVNLESDTTAKAVKEAVKEKEDRMVAHDVLKLEVKRLRDQLNARADEVFSLENRKMQLQLSMEERKHEVEVHRELLAAQLKMVQEDIHRATLEMRERAMKVGRLQNKFDILVNKVKREEGEEHSQAYYVIKAAQEREEMQHKGDTLDAKIRKAEKEVKALEATLEKMNGKNNDFRASTRKASDEGDLLATRAALREKLDAAYEKMKAAKDEETALRRDLDRHDQRLNALHDEAGALNGSLDHLETLAGTSEETLRQAATTAESIAEKLAEARDEYRRRAGVPLDDDGAVGIEELDLRTQELREGTRVVVSELKSVASRHPELASMLASYGVRLPGGEAVGA